jgi:hypothetical protein
VLSQFSAKANEFCLNLASFYAVAPREFRSTPYFRLSYFELVRAHRANNPEAGDVLKIIRRIEDESVTDRNTTVSFPDVLKLFQPSYSDVVGSVPGKLSFFRAYIKIRSLFREFEQAAFTGPLQLSTSYHCIQKIASVSQYAEIECPILDIPVQNLVPRSEVVALRRRCFEMRARLAVTVEPVTQESLKADLAKLQKKKAAEKRKFDQLKETAGTELQAWDEWIGALGEAVLQNCPKWGGLAALPDRDIDKLKAGLAKLIKDKAEISAESLAPIRAKFKALPKTAATRV